MENWIEFGQGPLFRLCIALMVLGLLRILALTVVGIMEAYWRSPDKIIDWKEVRNKTFAWLIPAGRLWTQRPLYSVTSFVFHVGMILVPVFLASHTLLWHRSVGFAWPTLPQQLANWMTVTVLFTGVGLFLGRMLHAGARQLSRLQDFAWPILLIVPFATGYVASNAMIGPQAYQLMMLLHIYSGDLIMVMIPFTKIAHCVLMPLSQVVTAVAWKFPAGAGDQVAATLGHADRPTWLLKARLNTGPEAPKPVKKGDLKK